MIKFKQYKNKLVNITVRNNVGHLQMLSGYFSTIGKDHVLFLDSDKLEHPFKKVNIVDVKIIKNPKS